MVAGTRAFRIEETLIDPPAINPPPTRHALFVFLVALAALLHFGTAGWGDLYDETDGQYAGAAREMIESGQWLLPTNDGVPRLQKPPVLYWLIIVSFKIFGVNAAAARLPIALATVAATAVDVLDRRTIARSLARIPGRSHLSLIGRHIFAWENHHARARLCRLSDRQFLLCSVWLPATTTSLPLVRRHVDLRGLGLPNEEHSWTCLFGSRALPARNFLSGSASSFQITALVAVPAPVPAARRALVHMGRTCFSGIVRAAGPFRLDGALFAHGR